MYCTSCGAQNRKGSKYCGECGSALGSNSRRAAAASRKWKVFCWMLPFIFLLGGSAFLMLAYEKETSVNQDVLRQQEEMLAAVKEGNLEEAMSANEHMLAVRPEETAFQKDKEELETAAAWIEEQSGVVKQIEALEFSEAEQAMNTLEEKAEQLPESFSDMVSGTLQETETMLVLEQTKQEIKELESVHELGGKLSTLENIENESAASLAGEIHTKIENIAFDNASDLLTQGNLSAAREKVEAGLNYIPENEKLAGLQTKIEQEQLAVEKAAQKEKEKQLIETAAEDQKNQTDAVEVVQAEASVDEQGDLHLDGEVKNNGTAVVSNVNVELAVYENSQHIGDVVLTASPYDIEPGRSGQFTDFYIGPYDSVNVEVTDASWYVK
ncbi:zinc-ribbon domain-containing protein [Salibacterium sp. K-3]